jgi:hypothetical protein
MILATTNALGNSAVIKLLEIVYFPLLITVPIIAVWRWSFLGVFIGTLTNEMMIIIISAIVTNYLKSQELNYENYEAWKIWAIIWLMYSFFVWLIKCFIRILIKLTSP